MLRPSRRRFRQSENVRAAGSQDDDVRWRIEPLEFIQEVRQEVSKVTWPTWKEVWITTAMVLVMVTLASIFFLFADQIDRLG